MKVVILAGNVRHPETLTGVQEPPALPMIGGQPLLWHSLRMLRQFGDHEFIIVTHRDEEAVAEWVRRTTAEHDTFAGSDDDEPHGAHTDDDQSPWQTRICSVPSPVTLEVAVRALAAELQDATFLVTSEEQLSDLDLNSLQQCHRRHGRLATMAVVKPEGLQRRIELAGSQVVGCHDADRAREIWLDAGFYLFEPAVPQLLCGHENPADESLLERLAADGQLMSYQHSGFWREASSPEQLRELNELWSRDQAPWRHGDRTPLCSVSSKRRVFVTGCDGYIGSVLMPRLQAAGHQVTGVDSQLYASNDETASPSSVPILRIDIRDVSVETLRGFDTVVHLASLSSEELAMVLPEATYDINYRGTIQLAEKAKAAGVSQFIFPSSCGIYDATNDGWFTERARLNPVTPYSIALALTEMELSRLANDHFSPLILRMAEGYGVSPSFRGDLTVHRELIEAIDQGRLSPPNGESHWRPVIHVEDIARAVLAAIGVPRERLHNQILNVGSTSENYRRQDLVAILLRLLPSIRIDQAPEATDDTQDYRVCFELLRRRLPEYAPQWQLAHGLRHLVRHIREAIGTEGSKPLSWHRQQQIQRQLEAGHLDSTLRWKPEVLAYRRAAA